MFELLKYRNENFVVNEEMDTREAIFAELIRRFRLSISGFPWTVDATWLVSIGRTWVYPSGIVDWQTPAMSFRACRSVANGRTSICKVAEFPKLATTRPRKQGRNASPNLGIFSRANKRGGLRMRIYVAQNIWNVAERLTKW